MSPVRTDIQALRGFAVLLVVLYHAKIGPLGAGYLGVDVFFVISGYLITSLIAKGIAKNSFSLVEFYLRRAKRLLPAAYVTFAVTAMVAPWFLNDTELHEFALQVVGAVTFTGNLVLWQQTGYFGGEGELKPLLHVWSLSLEEQYYLVLPALLLWLPRRHWMAAVLVATVASFALCLAGTATWPDATFYLLPTRAWELLIGSAGALFVLGASEGQRQHAGQVARVLFYPSLLALLVIPLHPVGGAHPGLDALIVCTATLVVILRAHGRCASWPPVRLLARIGDISYSLYLVHWPILALLKNAWVGWHGDLPLWLRLPAIVLSLAAAMLLHRFVEEPARRARIRLSRSLLAKAALASAAVLAIAPLGIAAVDDGVDYRELRQPVRGLHPSCDYKAGFEQRPECQGSAAPRVLVWGNSFAMHLVPGLEAELGTPALLQATQSGCGPFLGVAPMQQVAPGRSTVYGRDWALNCMAFNAAVLDFLKAQPSIDTVVLSTPWERYLNAARWQLLSTMDGEPEARAADVQTSLRALAQTVAAIQAAGKKVVLFGPPPEATFDVGGCLERKLSGRIAIGAGAGCAIAAPEFRSRAADTLRLLDQAAKAGLPVIRLDTYLCDQQHCRTLFDNTLVYWDHSHLSVPGSKLLARRMGWASLIEQQAR